jgi:hypothetical protein
MTQTTIEGGLLIRPVARFVAIGLFLMAFFATLWALWALYGLPTVLAVVLVAIFVTLSLALVAFEDRAAGPPGHQRAVRKSAQHRSDA